MYLMAFGTAHLIQIRYLGTSIYTQERGLDNLGLNLTLKSHDVIRLGASITVIRCFHPFCASSAL